MEENRLASYIVKKFQMRETNTKGYSPLTLAFIGDSVFDLIIKTIIVERANQSVNHLHENVSELVRAKTQADMADILWDDLEEEEQAVYKRGKNAKIYRIAKNATRLDYHKATGFEALIGKLYLDNQLERAIFLVKEGMERLNISPVKMEDKGERY